MAKLNISNDQYLLLNEIRLEMKKDTFKDTLEWLIDCHNLNRALIATLRDRALENGATNSDKSSDYEKI